MGETRATVFTTAILAVLVAPAPASAAPLTIAQVSAPQINCVFQPSCQLTVTDSVAHLPPTPGYSGTAVLQSRTAAAAKKGVPGAGTTVYLYRVDLSQAQPQTDQMCVTAVEIEFGPVVPLPYGGQGNTDVFVVTGGGLGTIGLESAVQTGAAIKFQISQNSFPDPQAQYEPVCPGQSSFFFGLAAKKKPAPTKAKVTMGVYGVKPVAARAPQ